MRAAALILLAVAAVAPRPARLFVGVLGGGFLVRAVWTSGFDQGGSRIWLAGLAVVLAGAAAMVLPDAVPDALPDALTDASPEPAAGGAEPAGWRWVVLAASVACAYACVPETDQFREMAVIVVAGVAIEVLGVRVLPGAAFVGAWAAVAWATLYGATGRPSALVGGLVALAVPVAASFASRRRGSGWAGLVIGTVWGVAAMAVARTGGISSELRPAVAAGAMGVAAAAAVSAMLWRRLPTAPNAG